MRVLDAKPVNLDGFSVTNPELGLVAMRSPFDPEPSLVVRDGVVVELDGKVLAGLAVDVGVPRAEVVRLIGGTTPAKLARVIAVMTPVEMQMAMSKMRARRTPGNQAHVT